MCISEIDGRTDRHSTAIKNTHSQSHGKTEGRKEMSKSKFQGDFKKQ